MKKGGLDTLYYFFTGEERFRLYLEALYRGDEAEVRRLVESCPRVSYSMNEAAYADRCKASKEIVEVLCSALVPRLAQLRMLEAFREELPYSFDVCINEAVFAYLDGHEAGSKRAWEAAGKTGDPPAWREREEGDAEDEDSEMDRELQSLRRITSRLEKMTGGFVGRLEELMRCIIKEILTIWEAFVDCCNQECGIEPEKLVKVWFGPMLPDDLERLKNLPDLPEVDPKGVEEYASILKQFWSELTRLC